jgi:predicted nucleic acid-binding protein
MGDPEVIAVVDAGPLYAVADTDDRHHDACLAVMSRADLQLVIAGLAVAEATYFVGSRLGSRSEARFLQGIGEFDIECPAREDWPRIAELVETYADFPLGGTDASVIALAERLEAPAIVTLDRRHFAAIRPRHCNEFVLLP